VLKTFLKTFSNSTHLPIDKKKEKEMMREIQQKIKMKKSRK
jgi:hypothetical protein